MSVGPRVRFFKKLFVLDRRALVLRLVFAGLAFLIVSALALRPIPSVEAHNDTGRYIVNQAEACSLPVFGNSEVSFPEKFFDLVMHPDCWVGVPEVFLFTAASALPIALLLFGGWDRQASLPLSIGLLLSTVGFEFMTNALRQGVGLAFLFAAIGMRRRSAKIAFLLISMLIHDSNWFFAPLVLLISSEPGEIHMRKIIRWGIPAALLAGFLLYLRFREEFHSISAILSFYQKSYHQSESHAFLLYIVCPLVVIFGIRFLDFEGPSREERIAFWYSAAILAISMIIFPEITYRFAMPAIALQIFSAMRSKRVSVPSGVLVCYCLMVHFLIYAFWAKNVTAVLFG